MASVNEYIDERLIISDIKTETKEETIRVLTDKIFELKSEIFTENFSSSSLYAKIIERENIQTTGLGNGIAFPHARIEKFKDLALAIGVSKKGIDWESFDRKPCNIICLMISPQLKPYLILQTMAVLARFLSEDANIAKMVKGLPPERIADMIRESALVTERTVLAKDIMRPVEKYVTLETSIEETTQIMHLNHLDILPVIDENHTLLGEISCLDIFTYGIPDFFNQLQTISFMKSLDPFEKYFKFRKNLKVKDIYSRQVNEISKDTTLMEIVFEMTAKNKLKLFVVDSGRLIGTIDRFSVIDKILFF
jgi:PTS system nitrogen regulatory IIA component